MVRRSFRVGLRVGLLVGVAFALVKTVQARRSTPSPDPGGPGEGRGMGVDAPPPPSRDTAGPERASLLHPITVDGLQLTSGLIGCCCHIEKQLREFIGLADEKPVLDEALDGVPCIAQFCTG